MTPPAGPWSPLLMTSDLDAHYNRINREIDRALYGDASEKRPRMTLDDMIADLERRDGVTVKDRDGRAIPALDADGQKLLEMARLLRDLIREIADLRQQLVTVRRELEWMRSQARLK